jgi:hypothetical protein
MNNPSYRRRAKTFLDTEPSQIKDSYVQLRETCANIWENILLIFDQNGQGSGVKRLLRTAQHY